VPQNNNYFKIGVFTLTGGALFLAGLLAFGLIQSVFEENVECVTYFNRSVQGLAADSAVKFRGFRVGRVTAIALASMEDAQGQPVVQVEFEIDPRSLAGHRDSLNLEEAREYLASQTQAGLRAVLSFQGITGIGFLDLDYQGDARADILSESMRLQTGGRQEVYIPSGPGQIMEIGESVTALVKSLSDVDFSGISRDVNTLVQTVDQAVADLNTGQMSADFTSALGEIRRAAADLGLLIDGLRGAVEGNSGAGLGREMENTVAQLRQTLKRLDQALGSSQGNLPVTLDNLRVMSENFRELSELLKAQPSQAFFGEPPAKNGPVLRSSGSGNLNGPQR
jgi:paraquat-inducible protein B